MAGFYACLMEIRYSGFIRLMPGYKSGDMKFSFVLLPLGLMLSACVSAPPVQSLSPELQKVAANLEGLDSLSPNLRASVLYKELKNTVSKTDMQKIADTGNSMAMVVVGNYHKYDGEFALAKNWPKPVIHMKKPVTLEMLWDAEI